MPQYIKKTYDTNRVSVERVASGTGLVNVYNFLAETFPERVDKTVHAGGKMSGRNAADGRHFGVAPVPYATAALHLRCASKGRGSCGKVQIACNTSCCARAPKLS